MRYANDLLLTDLARRITNEMGELNTMLTNGHLNDAIKKAGAMRDDLNGLMNRLGDVTLERA
jgi:hypothetical protein